MTIPEHLKPGWKVEIKNARQARIYSNFLLAKCIVATLMIFFLLQGAYHNWAMSGGVTCLVVLLVLLKVCRKKA